MSQLRDLAMKMWEKRHTMTTSEWMEGGPVLLGMVVADLSENSGGEAALAIGEDAFRAGVKYALKAAADYADHQRNVRVHADYIPQGVLDLEAAACVEGWSEYDPPEHIKALA